MSDGSDSEENEPIGLILGALKRKLGHPKEAVRDEGGSAIVEGKRRSKRLYLDKAHLRLTHQLAYPWSRSRAQEVQELFEENQRHKVPNHL